MHKVKRHIYYSMILIFNGQFLVESTLVLIQNNNNNKKTTLLTLCTVVNSLFIGIQLASSLHRSSCNQVYTLHAIILNTCIYLIMYPCASKCFCILFSEIYQSKMQSFPGQITKHFLICNLVIHNFLSDLQDVKDIHFKK